MLRQLLHSRDRETEFSIDFGAQKLAKWCKMVVETESSLSDPFSLSENPSLRGCRQFLSEFPP